MIRSYSFFLLFSCFLLILPLNNSARAQFRPGGLPGRTVHSLGEYNGVVYAGTDTGVYALHLYGGDTAWTLIGLAGKIVRAIYPHQQGAIGHAITAGVQLKPADPDSTVIFCSCLTDTIWVPADSGIDHSAVRAITTIDGFPSLAICGETFAAGAGRVYRKTGNSWEKVFDPGSNVINVIRANAANVTVWAGGETAIFSPSIARSDDKGTTWTQFFPNLNGDNACNSIAFDPHDTSVVYAGMEGTVIKSTDGGETWTRTGLTGTPYYFRGLVLDDINGSIFAGGVASPNQFGLFQSGNGGLTWSPIVPLDSLPGLLCMIILPTIIPEQNDLLIGTNGGGLIRYSYTVTGVSEHRGTHGIFLEQNYPNPVNPETAISFQLSSLSRVTLNIFDILGRTVATLFNGVLQPGRHTVMWNAGTAASGVYFYRLEAIPADKAGYFVSTKKLILLR